LLRCGGLGVAGGDPPLSPLDGGSGGGGGGVKVVVDVVVVVEPIS